MSKVDVISGFLGAGKTTLIQKLIKDVFAGKKVVLVENEFGEIGIDGGFLKEAGITINEINGGCVCCTLQGDFHDALEKVENTYHPDHIIIEPSGVGKLSDILSIIKSVEGLELNSYSAVVDAKRCKIYHKNFKEFFDDQISTACCVILSRTQMVNEEKLNEDVSIIRELNPDVRIITTPWDDLNGESIYEAMTGSSNGFPEGLEELDFDEEEHEHHHHDEEEHECCCGHHHDEEHECHHHHDEEEHECCCGHHHDEEHECCHHHDHSEEIEHANEGLSEGNKVHIGGGEHEHHHHHHHHHGLDADDVFDSIGIETVNRYTEDDIREALKGLGENIVRAKGIVPAADGSWLFFDYVPGDVDIRTGKAAYTGLITVIGEHVDVENIKTLFRVK
ncbi:MAG: CobW family GTP-binding protein [Erysipelotrichaceae bacterium]|nr:CobW family GTP-binding protein [Erysipelotrichaceae bacterium]